VLGAYANASLQTPSPTPRAEFRIVVIEGEDAVNIVQQKTAVAPVVEIRDRNDLPVAGVPVIFTLTGGNTAAFAGGAQTLTMTTNAAGRAIAAGFTPLGSGAVQINVTAVVQGQSVAATIAQTNFLTVAQAAEAGAASTASGGTGAAGSGGGLSQGAVAGIAGGAAAGAVATAVAVKGQDATPVVTIDRAPAVTGIVDVTAFTFTAATTSTESITYAWDFGDGATGAGTTVRHVYAAAGSFTVTLRARIAGGEQTSTTSLDVRALSSAWTGPETADRSAVFRLLITQQARSLSGQFILEPRPGSRFLPENVPLTGQVDDRTITIVQNGACGRTLVGGIDAALNRMDLRVVSVVSPSCPDVGLVWTITR
jgi:hypothetical protein